MMGTPNVSESGSGGRETCPAGTGDDADNPAMISAGEHAQSELRIVSGVLAGCQGKPVWERDERVRIALSDSIYIEIDRGKVRRPN